MALGELDVFMAAIRRRESGSFAGKYDAIGRRVANGDRARGAYQIMGQYWDGWAKAAGIPGADWRSRMAQDTVARYLMTKYYEEYGDWRLVAAAWNGGRGAANKARKEGFGAISPEVQGYVKAVTGYMHDAVAEGWGGEKGARLRASGLGLDTQGGQTLSVDTPYSPEYDLGNPSGPQGGMGFGLDLSAPGAAQAYLAYLRSQGMTETEQGPQKLFPTRTQAQLHEMMSTIFQSLADSKRQRVQPIEGPVDDLEQFEVPSG